MEKVIIAVDAGGSKTKICIINREKTIVETFMEGAGSPAVLKEEALVHIHDGISKAILYAKKKMQVVGIIVGVSALGVIGDIAAYQNKLEKEFQVKTRVISDATLALYSVFTDLYQEGVLVLSGTGSAVLAFQQEKMCLVGGYGHLLTEVGSAFTVVRDLIKTTIQQFENNQTFTDLSKQWMELLGFTELNQFRSFMYQNTKTKIASYARFVVEKANENNPHAIQLLQVAGKDLAHDVRNAIKALNLRSPIVLGFRGGFICNAPIAQQEVISILEKEWEVQVVKGEEDPIYGAYYLAWREGILC